MLRNSFFAFALLALVGLVGCGSQKGQTVMSMGKGKTPAELATVGEGKAGDYAVYANTSYVPIRVATLKEGDEYGFAKGTDGKLYASLGDAQVPLESTMSSGYYIKYQK